jgi:hypothetical protein
MGLGSYDTMSKVADLGSQISASDLNHVPCTSVVFLVSSAVRETSPAMGVAHGEHLPACIPGPWVNVRLRG